MNIYASLNPNPVWILDGPALPGLANFPIESLRWRILNPFLRLPLLVLQKGPQTIFARSDDTR
jgi:hypothetical protein